MNDSSKAITAKNLGPIDQLSVTLNGYGVTVLRAPNGSGKSIFLSAVEAAARGKGRLPLRDGQRRGAIDAFGAHITIGAATRHSGDFEILSLEGRFNLAELVDPGLKDPAAADRRRIAALVGISGREITKQDFMEREEFQDFDSIFPEYATVAVDTDPIDLVGQVKRAYEAASRKAADRAKTDEASAKSLEESAERIDTTAESDEVKLRTAVENARDELTELRTLKSNYDQVMEQRKFSEQELRKAKESYTGPTVEEAVKKVDDGAEGVEAAQRTVEEAEAVLQEAKDVLSDARHQLDLAKQARDAAAQHQATVESYEKVLAASVPKCPTDEDMADAERAVTKAQEASEQGAVIRKAIKDKEQAESYRVLAKSSHERSARYRDAAKATADILSDLVDSEFFRVQNDGDAPCVVVDHKRGKDTPYHVLSPGEKWPLAIREGARIVGEDGLLVIPQEAWEPIDGFTRPIIHREAIEHKVYILTAEATQDTAAGRDHYVETIGKE